MTNIQHTRPALDLARHQRWPAVMLSSLARTVVANNDQSHFLATHTISLLYDLSRKVTQERAHHQNGSDQADGHDHDEAPFMW